MKMMKLDRLLGELKRRHVLRVVGAYAVAAWIAVEVFTTVQPILWPEHEWTNRLFVVLALLGFPAVFALAWIFDITPTGVRRTPSLAQVAGLPARATAEAEPAPGMGLRVRGPRRLGPVGAGFFGLGILVAIVGIAAYAGYHEMQPREPTDIASIESIAVLPFADMSPARNQEYFSDGIAEELLNRLARVPSLRVPARTSSFAFRDREDDVREIGRRLGVQAVLEGSVRRDGDRLRVGAQLVDVASGYRLWSASFEGDAASVFELQDEIANAIIQTLSLHFAAAPEAGVRGTKSTRALDHYYRGVREAAGRTDRDLRAAVASFSAALREDANFALALAAIAQAYAVLPAYGSFPVDSAMTLGMAAAAQALRLDPTLADAYAALGQLVQNVDWDLRAAEDYYKRALHYKPSDAAAHVWYAETLMLLGEFDNAAEHVVAATAIDPLSPISLHTDAMLQTLRGDNEEALAAWRNITRLNPDFHIGFRHHAYSAAAAGRGEEAARSLERLASADAARADAYAPIIAALRGEGSAADALAALRADTTLASLERAAWTATFGDRPAAIAALQQVIVEHDDITVPFILVHPVLRSLRSDPRFRRLLDDVGVVIPAR
jgi:adenylate cyclase